MTRRNIGKIICSLGARTLLEVQQKLCSCVTSVCGLE